MPTPSPSTQQFGRVRGFKHTRTHAHTHTHTQRKRTLCHTGALETSRLCVRPQPPMTAKTNTTAAARPKQEDALLDCSSKAVTTSWTWSDHTRRHTHTYTHTHTRVCRADNPLREVVFFRRVSSGNRAQTIKTPLILLSPPLEGHAGPLSPLDSFLPMYQYIMLYFRSYRMTKCTPRTPRTLINNPNIFFFLSLLRAQLSMSSFIHTVFTSFT